MIQLPVYNVQGEQVSTASVDESRLGGVVRTTLLHQAVVMYQANRRQGTAATRSRGMVAGSTRKLYRQKGTGNARMGNVRTPIRRGGGMAFAKRTRDFGKRMPKRMRRAARDSAILAKMQSGDAMVVDGLQFERPRTREFAAVMDRLGVHRGALVAIHEPDANVVKSGRNLPAVEVMLVGQLNAYDVLRRAKLVFTPQSLDAVAGQTAPATAPADGEAQG